ncbi:hypothetical protein C8N40_1127 [Pontibacter mucosus]|uniref:N-acetyltransferase domain-containing protein n=1 Tax=Pontibacter mucosus TaxID=1649266 RepID=A0A2T5YCH3_9BACT|nr:GNAT family N-acetyltransferase [Pontibacter mucosus]PTX14161.1 hypothetical protein C8N40_1127 [Pontibacter mucosus]
MDVEVKDNPARHRYEATVEGKTAFIEYKLLPCVMKVLHTEVPKELEGRGLARTMTQFALKHIEEHNLQLVPLCPYMRSFLKKNPEYQRLVKQS